MHVTRELLLAAFAAFVCLSLAGAEPAITAPAPVYPLECRVRGITGKGVVLVTVDRKTGIVVGARVLKSTGNKLLDGFALEALSRWRFKPGTVSQVTIPIAFEMGSTR
jgi:TonB family protein